MNNMCKWHLEMSIEDDYRYNDDATNCWLGFIADEGADEVICLDTLIAQYGWLHAYFMANVIVVTHNASIKSID